MFNLIMPNNKTKRIASKAAERKSPSNVNQSESDKGDSKLLKARREQLRSSSMPAVETISEMKENENSRPKSAENNANPNNEDGKFKTLLHCMMAGEWIGALGRMSNLDEKSPELSQANVNI